MNTRFGVATPAWLPVDPSTIPGDPVVTVSVAVLGVLALAAGVRSLVRYLRIRSPAPAIVSLSPGTGAVEVVGVARPRRGDTLRSPFTDAPCLVCRSRVEAYYPNPIRDSASLDPASVLTPAE